MNSWQLSADLPAEAQRAFATLEQVFALEGQRMARDPISQVLRVEVGGRYYYVKQYSAAGKGIRRWLGQPRVVGEWANLQRFAAWGIPTAPVVGWGMQTCGGLFQRGAMITSELVGTRDLAALANAGDPLLRQRDWLERVMQQLAAATRCMHQHGFAHNDLKWRNLLVSDAGELFLIDCPTGSFWWGPMLDYRIIKDLACLDKVGRKVLSRTRRLRFYLLYSQHARLEAADKARIRRILAFFEGRE